MRNTSQDPEYVGPTGHEKKFHKTHFGVVRTLRKGKKDFGYAWIQVAPGRFKRVRKDAGQDTQKRQEVSG
jgi:hypothetical protein